MAVSQHELNVSSLDWSPLLADDSYRCEQEVNLGGPDDSLLPLSRSYGCSLGLCQVDIINTGTVPGFCMRHQILCSPSSCIYRHFYVSPDNCT